MRIPLAKFVTIILVLGLCAWSTAPSKSIENAQWLIGVWKNKSGDRVIYESWFQLDDNTLKGTSYVMKQQDRVVMETIRLYQENDKLYYAPSVKNQNQGREVRFASTVVKKDKLVFENSQHDFPQLISYTLVTADSLVAEISGTKNGQQRTIQFPMTRIKSSD